MKIRRVHIENHPVLGSLDLDFCGPDGRAVDTIIIAGENGVGKSTILGLLYSLISRHADNQFGAVSIEFEDAGQTATYAYELDVNQPNPMLYATNMSTGSRRWTGSDDFRSMCPMEAIYSDVDINFRADSLNSVTSLTLDSETTSRRSTVDLPTRIKQLLIDVQAL